MGKYKLINGIMVDTSKQSTSAPPMAIITSAEDLAIASEYNKIEIPTATVVAIENYTDDDVFTNKFNNKYLNYDELLEQLMKLFGKYEVPIGLLGKLCELSNYNVSIIVDDSGSMQADTDSLKKDVCTNYMLEYFKSEHVNMNSKMTRFQEEEDKIHLMIDFLAYIPIKKIHIRCMNRSDEITLFMDGQTPEDFLKSAHEKIRKMFSHSASGGTPTMKTIKQSLDMARITGNTAHYLFTDGVPSDCSTDELGRFLANRSHPKQNPLTFVSCTDVDSEAEWMKEIEEIGPYMAEIDDYVSEHKEVIHDQGSFFPYTKGLWIMCLLIGALNPEDLDAMDDSRPFTKYTLDNLMGRHLTVSEYQKYWTGHPKSKDYSFSDFSTKQSHASALIKTDSVTKKATKFFGGIFGR